MLLENFVFTVTSKWTCNRHIYLSTVRVAYDIADRFIQFIISHNLISMLNIIIWNFTISDQNNIFNIFLNNFLSNKSKLISSSTLFSINKILKLLFSNNLNNIIPKIIISNICGIKLVKLSWCGKIVIWTINRTWNIKDHVVFGWDLCVHLRYYFY